MAPIYAGTPHRYPMLLIDSCTERFPGRVRFLKLISANEMFLMRWKDTEPFLPSTLLVDALGQVATLLLREHAAESSAVWYLGGIDAMTFHATIPAGSVVQMDALILKRWKSTARIEVKASIGDQLVARGLMILSQGGSARDARQ